ncbi:ATP synthase subunit e, mitochondrial [Cladophialophora carrionii]|uniref:ATP synthase F(0) complex subunit e, mitochondrial n=1 Tax=Cladophialophora carrionii TaxID=86049 RepID=A0A1C1CLP4_9EURO|nr:ATP synthase subunit e, mitochondrial [Cladophialophora carrionii]
MSTSQGVNVLRWSALVAGIFYGFTHQRTITARNAAAHQKAEYDHKAELISKAKAEWAKKNLPPQSKTASGDDPNDKNFDLEAYLTKLQAES